MRNLMFALIMFTNGALAADTVVEKHVINDKLGTVNITVTEASDPHPSWHPLRVNLALKCTGEIEEVLLNGVEVCHFDYKFNKDTKVLTIWTFTSELKSVIPGPALCNTKYEQTLDLRADCQ